MMLTLHFGALVPSLTEQLTKAGVAVESKSLNQLQRDADAVVRLTVRGLLTDSEINRVRRKLMKKIIKAASLAPT